MKVLLFVSSLLSAFVAISALCDACIDGSCYSRRTVFEGYIIFGQIAIDTTGNILYFHCLNSQFKDFSSAISLDDAKFSLLPEAESSMAMAVDQATRDVYLSDVTRFFKYNPAKNCTSHIGLHEDKIFHLQFHQKLYYTKLDVKGLYTFENGKSKQIPALSKYKIYYFVIDKHNDIYFMSNNIIYRLKNGAKSPTLFANESYILATDNNGNVCFYQSITRVLYKLNYSNDELIIFGAFSQGETYKILFNRENWIVYYDYLDNKIYYLTPNNGRCRVTTHAIKGHIHVENAE